MNRLAALIPVLLLSACASAWQPSFNAAVDAGAGVQVDVPEGWYRIDEPSLNAIVLTQNGISIETITIARAPLGRSLPNTSPAETWYLRLLPRFDALVASARIANDTTVPSN